MRTDALNLRYLLWREGVRRDRWPEQLAQWTGTRDVARAGKLLVSGGLTVEEADAVGGIVGIDVEELMHGELFADADILIENVRFLLESMGHGGKKQVAEVLGVDQTTISRWISGKIRIKAARQRLLEKALGVKDGLHLDQHPFFLMDEPSSDQARRQWLHERVDRIGSDDLRALFPAFKRLLDN